MVDSDVWTHEQAESYDDPADPMFAPELLATTTAFLTEAADGGPVLEFAIGTGRVAIPLRARGVEVSGIELSAPMAQRLRAKAPEIAVTIGDMTSTQVPGEFALVCLVYNTIGNLRTQDAQVAAFANAAAHLSPGGRFVIENTVPPLRQLPPGQTAVPFDVTPDHLGVDTLDTVTQEATSHHWTRDGATYRYSPHHFRYVWPSELDLMARLAGLEFEARFADWERSPFTAESPSHVSVWRKP